MSVYVHMHVANFFAFGSGMKDERGRKDSVDSVDSDDDETTTTTTLLEAVTSAGSCGHAT